MQELILRLLGFENVQFYPVTKKDLRARTVCQNSTDPAQAGKAVLGNDGNIHAQNGDEFIGYTPFMTSVGYDKVSKSILTNDEETKQILQYETCCKKEVW